MIVQDSFFSPFTFCENIYFGGYIVLIRSSFDGKTACYLLQGHRVTVKLAQKVAQQPLTVAILLTASCTRVHTGTSTSTHSEPARNWHSDLFQTMEAGCW